MLSLMDPLNAVELSSMTTFYLTAANFSFLCVTPTIQIHGRSKLYHCMNIRQSDI